MRADKRSPGLNGRHINPGVKADERLTGDNAAAHAARTGATLGSISVHPDAAEEALGGLDQLRL